MRNHDNYLNTLKKANYLLKSKVDKWQDELRKERGRYKALEIELNTCLAELGWTIELGLFLLCCSYFSYFTQQPQFQQLF